MRSIWSNCAINQKKKMFEFGTKNALFGYYLQKTPWLSTFGLGFMTMYVFEIFEISTLGFAQLENTVK